MTRESQLMILGGELGIERDHRISFLILTREACA